MKAAKAAALEVLSAATTSEAKAPRTRHEVSAFPPTLNQVPLPADLGVFSVFVSVYIAQVEVESTWSLGGSYRSLRCCLLRERSFS